MTAEKFAAPASRPSGRCAASRSTAPAVATALDILSPIAPQFAGIPPQRSLCPSPPPLFPILFRPIARSAGRCRRNPSDKTPPGPSFAGSGRKNRRGYRNTDARDAASPTPSGEGYRWRRPAAREKARTDLFPSLPTAIGFSPGPQKNRTSLPIPFFFPPKKNRRESDSAAGCVRFSATAHGSTHRLFTPGTGRTATTTTTGHTVPDIRRVMGRFQRPLITLSLSTVVGLPKGKKKRRELCCSTAGGKHIGTRTSERTPVDSGRLRRPGVLRLPGAGHEYMSVNPA